MAWRTALNALLFACIFAPSAPAEPTLEIVAKGLADPSALAIRPGGTADHFEIFIAEPGAGRIAKWVSGADQPQPVITGFNSAGSGDDKRSTSAPHGLIFLDRTILVVLARDDDTLVRSYELSDDESLTDDSTKQKVGVARESGLSRNADGLLLHTVARTTANDRVPDLLICTATGDDEHRPLWKAPVRAGTIGDLTLFSTANSQVGAEEPAVVTVSDQGFVVVASPAADDNSPSELAFYNPIDGSRLMRLSCELPGIIALAYSPRTGNLYAAASPQGDNSSSEHRNNSGIYRIDDASQPGAPACRTTKIIDVTWPTAMTFAPDGALYITAKDEDTTGGVLLKLTGDL